MPTPLFRVAAGLAARLPAGVRGRNRLSSLRDGPEHAAIWGTPYFDVALRRRLLSEDVLEELGPDLDAPEWYALKGYGSAPDPVSGLTRLDFQQVLPDDFLVKVDRASMANSLEIRAPFLDHRLVEHAFREIPPHWKCTQSERRRVQNLMAKRYLPEGFELNRKQGFSVPMDEWMRDVKEERVVPEKHMNFFNINAIRALLNGQRRGRTNGARLFALMMLKASNI